ncbi:MAG: hypothetical protein ACXVZX_06370 [Terriglobales bacterium]
MHILTDPIPQYCHVRRTLEERGYYLTSRLSLLSTQLMKLIGNDRGAFTDTKMQCADVRDEIVDVRRELQEHRTEHGC